MGRTLLLLLLLSWTHAYAAAENGPPHLSPSGQYAIWNFGDPAQASDYFEIRTKDGSVLFAPKSDPKNSLGVDPASPVSLADDILWSPDEQAVLFTFHDGKYKVTCVFSFTAKRLTSLGHVLDGYTVPVHWHGSRTFVVENHWPMGGPARTQSRFRQTYRLHQNPFGVQCIHTSPTTKDKDGTDT